MKTERILENFIHVIQLPYVDHIFSREDYKSVTILLYICGRYTTSDRKLIEIIQQAFPSFQGTENEVFAEIEKINSYKTQEDVLSLVIMDILSTDPRISDDTFFAGENGLFVVNPAQYEVINDHLFLNKLQQYFPKFLLTVMEEEENDL